MLLGKLAHMLLVVEIVVDKLDPLPNSRATYYNYPGTTSPGTTNYYPFPPFDRRGAIEGH